ncbi:MAG: hypothetical protein EOP83_20130, partial [Verrucomicrobiaceae bacterium]
MDLKCEQFVTFRSVRSPKPMRPILAFCTLASLCSGWATANPVISEFMASNKATAVDEEGNFSDWIELHNPTTAPVSLDGWYLTDSAADLKKWKFPNVTLAPGEFRLVWASGENRRFPNQPLHANFSLSADGEYLALVQPDGTTVAQDLGANYPAQRGDESFGGRFLRTVLVAPGANTRYRVPASASDPGATWTQTAFSDATWASGASGLGHGLTVPGITVRMVCKNGTMAGLSDADSLLALPAGHSSILSETTVTADTVNYLGDGSDGHFELNTSPPLGASDNYTIKLTGWVDIPSAGIYTFGTNSDDGVRLKIDGSTLFNDDSGHAPLDNFGSRNLTAGLHSFEVVMFQGSGGDALEFFAAAGQYT